MLSVSITDPGTGILPNEKEKLFKAFSKLPTRGQENAEGIGMGLAICKNIVEKSKGFINVISRGEDQGSTFVFGMRMRLLDLNLG